MDNIINELYSSGALFFIFWLAIGIVIFLLLRELMTWYWKINENTEYLKRIADSLENIAMVANLAVVDSSKQNTNQEIPEDRIVKNFKKKVLSDNQDKIKI